MRSRATIFILLFPFLVTGQTSFVSDISDNSNTQKTSYYLSQFLKTDLPLQNVEPVLCFIKKLEDKKSNFKNDREFLHYLFVKTHQKLLKRYTEYCSFSSMLQNGTYNCLTGTALYALLLEHFGIDYTVIETNYHIFLVAKTSKGLVLFESTDPINGFVKSTKEIAGRMDKYKKNELVPSDNDKAYYRYQFDLFNTVSLDQLLGLMYYNLSIQTYNQQAYSLSISHLDEAVKLYPSARLEELSKIILLTLTVKDLNKSEKEICLQKIQSLRKKMPGLASSTINGH